ncbi:MAG: GH57, partial [uncultured Chloroflexia bacterium]
FRHRFGRAPQGLWLPEAGVDNETLSVMADHGIEFTILAPWQADTWDLDPTEPYRVALPNGRSIVAFFYHRDLSGRVSFDAALTSNADAFAMNDLRRHFQNEKASRDEPQLLLVASDGELYGHHQPFRDYFLAHLLKNASAQIGITPTYPARWLREHPPRRTIKIRDNTSWSCHHGVVRWLGNCDCAGGQGHWKWPLRHALDQLAARLDHVYDDVVRPMIDDPWELRNRYIHVVLGEQTLGDLVGEMAGRRLDVATVERIALLLEMQRERQRMFTSCGWFFDDFDRIEPKNNVAYAAQAVRLAERATGADLAAETRAWLQQVVSWRSGIRGDQVFDQHMQYLEA